METVYLYSAVIGGAFLVIQTLLLFLGGDHGADHDIAPDVDTGDLHVGDADAVFLKILSFKTIVAFLTFFGLTGLSCIQGGLSPTTTALLAIGAGVVAIYVVAYMMAALAKLQSRGNLDLKNAIGKQAKVYLRVPEKRSGSGKVIVTVQGRKLECKAVTEGPELPTGVEVIVVNAPSSDTLEVATIAS